MTNVTLSSIYNVNGVCTWRDVDGNILGTNTTLVVSIPGMYYLVVTSPTNCSAASDIICNKNVFFPSFYSVLIAVFNTTYVPPPPTTTTTTAAITNTTTSTTSATTGLINTTESLDNTTSTTGGSTTSDSSFIASKMSSTNSTNMAGIIGGVVGGVVLLVLIVLAVILLTRKKQKKSIIADVEMKPTNYDSLEKVNSTNYALFHKESLLKVVTSIVPN